MWSFVNEQKIMIDGKECYYVTDVVEEVPENFLENDLLKDRYIETQEEVEVGNIITRDGEVIYVEEDVDDEEGNEQF